MLSSVFGTAYGSSKPLYLIRLFPSFVLLPLLLLVSLGCRAGNWSIEGLDASSDKVISTLSSIPGATSPRSVVLSTTDFFDVMTGMSQPLAVHLRDNLAKHLSNAGFRVRDPGASTFDTWVVQCRWKDRGDRLALTYTATPWLNGKRGIVRVIASRIPMTDNIRYLLEPDLASYGRTLVHRLALNEILMRPQRVHLRPVRVANQIGGTELNDYFNTWLKDAVTENHLLVAVQTRNELARLDSQTLRTRGIRPTQKPTMSLTGSLVAAEAELMGEVEVRSNAVSVKVALQGPEGEGLSDSLVTIPLTAFPPGVAANLASGSQKRMAAKAPISVGGLEIELATSHGDGKAIYRIGEQVAFLIRVNRRSYVYLFDVNSNDEAALLFPAPDGPEIAVPEGRLLLLPEDGMSYELKVVSPPGQDLVWAVATETPLLFPKHLTGRWARGDFLQQQVRDLGRETGSFAEAQLVLQTIH